MGPAAIRQQGPVAQFPGRQAGGQAGDPGSLVCLAIQVGSDPGFAFAQEGLHGGKGIARPGPAGRHGDDHATQRIDRDSHPARPCRAAQDVVELATGQGKLSGFFSPAGHLAGTRTITRGWCHTAGLEND